jgi:acetyl-CoA carboxylase alpha subunit
MGAEPDDWRDAVLTGATELRSSPTLKCAVARFDDQPAVVAAWQFSRQGGAFGEADADVLIAAVDEAIARRLPLVTLIRSGGTKVTEGMRALVGIPRTALGLARLSAAHLPHVSVADHPTTGGIWVSVGSTADVRLAVEGAVVGFSGPRAVTAMTGRDLPEGANTAESAHAAGLVDAVTAPEETAAAVGRVLAALAPGEQTTPAAPTGDVPPPRDAWEQVTTSRDEPRPDGATLIDTVLSGGFGLAAADDTVAAVIGHLAGRQVIAVALAARRGVMPTPAGFGLLARGAGLASALDIPLVVFVDTPGADPHTETLGLAASIAGAMTAVLDCAAPTISLVHGEGGSGGALAGAVTDVVGVGDRAWFAAMGPEGAAATLRVEPAEAARRMSITPRDLLATGFGDVYVPGGLESMWLATTIDRLHGEAKSTRLARRRQRWSSALPGHS